MIEHILTFVGAFFLTLAGLSYILADGISFEEVQKTAILFPAATFLLAAATCLLMGAVRGHWGSGIMFALVFCLVSIPYQNWSDGRRWKEWFHLYKLSPRARAGELHAHETRYRRQAAWLFVVGSVLTMFGAVAAFVDI